MELEYNPLQTIKDDYNPFTLTQKTAKPSKEQPRFNYNPDEEQQMKKEGKGEKRTNEK